MFNVHETSENVFQSGEPSQPHEWNTIVDIGKDRGKPVAIIDLRAERTAGHRLVCPDGWANIWMPIPDWSFSINPYFYMSDFFKAVGYMAKSLHDNGYILWFHCAAGISRSTAGNIAFRMIQYQETVDVALEAIRRVRSFVGPNQHFRDALLEIEEELYGKTISSKEDPEDLPCKICGIISYDCLCFHD